MRFQSFLRKGRIVPRLSGFLATWLLIANNPVAQEAPTPTAKPLLWKIEGSKDSYLFGTIHLPDDRVLALAPVVEKAAEACDALYIEVPLEQLSQARSLILLSEGRKLSSILPPDVRERIQRILAPRRLPFALFESYKIWALLVQLPLLDYLPQLATTLPMDAVLYAKAEAAGKEIGGIETLQEQIGIFDQFTEDEQIELLKDALDQIEEEQAEGAEKSLERLLKLYLEGDLDELLDFMNSNLDEEDALDLKFLRLVFSDRNHRMADRIALMLSNNPEKSHFIAIGAGHLGSSTGVLELLRGKGLKLDRLGPRDLSGIGRP